jgi:two-component system LytT family response regulator
MKKFLIVDDDLFIQKVVREVVIQHFPDFSIIGIVGTVAEALAVIKDDSPDLILLDISLPDGTGFDLLRKVEFFDFKLVFMSGHENYLRDAVQFSAVSYVAKPFDVSDLVQAIDKACEAIDEKEYHQKIEILLSNTNLSAFSRMVVFPGVDLDHAVVLSSILYGEAIPGGCIMHIDSGKDIYVPRPLRRYEQMFLNYLFLRCHPLYVVNLKRIQSVDESSFTLILDDGGEVPFEPRKYEVLKRRYYEAGI